MKVPMHQSMHELYTLFVPFDAACWSEWSWPRSRPSSPWEAVVSRWTFSPSRTGASCRRPCPSCTSLWCSTMSSLSSPPNSKARSDRNELPYHCFWQSRPPLESQQLVLDYIEEGTSPRTSFYNSRSFDGRIALKIAECMQLRHVVPWCSVVFHGVRSPGDVDKIRKAVIGGSAAPLLMFLVWNTVILGSVSSDAGLVAEAAGGVFDPLQVCWSTWLEFGVTSLS